MLDTWQDLALATHKGVAVKTRNAAHYFKSCRSNRLAVQLKKPGQPAEIHAYHAMGVARQLRQVQTVVIRVRSLRFVHIIARALHYHFPGLTMNRKKFVVWAEDREELEEEFLALWQ